MDRRSHELMLMFMHLAARIDLVREELTDEDLARHEMLLWHLDAAKREIQQAGALVWKARS